jgi:hypothetical protein
MVYLVTMSNSVAMLLLMPLNVSLNIPVYCRFVFLPSMALDGRCMFWYRGYCLWPSISLYRYKSYGLSPH